MKFLSTPVKGISACLVVNFLFLALLLVTSPSKAQNAIVNENALPGTAPTQWDITGAGDLSIQGFATDISVNKGERVHFKIKTDASAYSIIIYRVGYYQGKGARRIGKGKITATLPQTQPEPLYDESTGLTDCGNWAESAYWNVPATAVTGIYIAKLTRTDNGGSSHIVFIVRDDASHSDLFFQTSDATWQAYNAYGGNSLYVGITSYPAGHAAKVSYNRPFITRDGGGGGGASEDWLFNSEYPMIRFLERNGYDVSYTTDVDADRRGNLMLNHKVYMSVGHDEYWSAGQRANVEAARNAGVHLAFFSGNEIYWKTRYESSADGSNTPYRTLVCYKEGTLGENVCGGKCDPLSTVWTGLWRDGCSYPSADGCRPENALSGQISWNGTAGAMQVPDTYKNLRFWRNTSITNLGTGQTATLSANSLGYEWNPEQYPESYPPGRIHMSSTTLDGQVHHLSLYRHSSGAMVFGAGTVQWAWGLDNKHDRGNAPADIRMQQATVNLLADMGTQPATLQTNLVAATASTDHQAPSSTITNPASNASVPAGSPVTITGTAADVGGGVVAGIEISVDGGATWHVANGTSNWTYTWTPSTEGTVTIKSRAVDDNVNLETPGTAPAPNAVTINVSVSQATCPCTIFQPSDVPDIPVANDNTGGIENGVKFKASKDGFITGIRFYKGSGNTGTHVGQLWSLTGTLLAQATFLNESASGWQEVAFDSPVPITAGTVYVAANFSSAGFYAYTDEYFTTEKVNGPLHALADSDPNGPNGVYIYTANPAFPVTGFQRSNYWVDVVFANTVAPDHTPPTVVSTVPVSNAQNVNVNSPITATFSEAVKPVSVNSVTVKLTNSSTNKAIAATVAYDAGTHSAILTPSSPLIYSTSYTVTIKGGTDGQHIKDNANNALAANYTWTFTTSAPPPPTAAEGPGGPILLISSSLNLFSRYPVEILKAQGLNEYKAMDIAQITASVLNKYDVVIVGNINLTAAKVTLLTNWANAGGTLIAFRPDKKLANLLGLTVAAETHTDKYLLVNTATGPGIGIVNQTIQYHGTADHYTLNGASSIATLYSDANTPTVYPAVTTNNVGTNGGKAIAFTYDLARSIVYTRQGNPAWAGQKRDGQIEPIRSDDQFFPDWVDFNKIAIPQADEQMHLLTNIILLNNLHKKPLPRFWFLPRGLKAAVLMTGDDHGNGGTIGRFNQYESLGPNDAQSVANWTAIRGTSYIYPGTPITNAQATAFQSNGFEIALHTSTNCQNFTPASLENNYATQLAQFAQQLPGINPPATNRTHCITWSDWASEPKTAVAHGIRLDANYYYWPASWIQDRPGMFTGSGMPMRFADLDGSMIDCYQVVTQMTDESGISYSNFINQLLDKAQGAEGYYGVFCANMHTDNDSSEGSDAIIASAQAHQVPVISAKQMLDWLDGRNGSSFGSVKWSGNALNFSITAGNGANNIQAMLPTNSATGQLQSISLNGSPIPDTIQTIKGIQYAFFNAAAGNYVAIYGSGIVQPIAKASPMKQSKVDDLDLKVSPNPSADGFTLVVTSNSQIPYQIRIIDLYGKNIYLDKGLATKTFRFGKTFMPGLYIVQALQADKIKTLKIMKSN